jgi:phosphoserine phosphatase RsbU/P
MLRRHSLGRDQHIQVNKAMPNITIETPNWLQHMESILEELNEGVAIVDDQVRIIFANETLTRLGQSKLEDIKGRTPDAIFPPEDMQFILRQHESTHRHGRTRYEFYLPRKDRKKVPVISSGRAVQGPDGREYVVVTVTDISEQKRVEAQLRESNALLEVRQKEIEAELSIAECVQQSLAPRSLVWNKLAVEACYSPAHTIGGDFGIVLPHSDDFLDVIVCDVSGHGIGSALMANRIYSEMLNALERTSKPANLLQRLHAFVHDRIPQDGFFFTMSTARFHQCGRRMTFAAAGQPPAILVSNGSLRLLASRNGILGCLSETAPSDSSDEIELAPGDRLLLYTDGLVEVFNRSEDMLGVEGLEALIRQAATRTLPEMKQAILDGAATWSHGPLADDVSLIIVEVR